MGKKIKITERQNKLINNIKKGGIKISESQYKRIFENNINESIIVEFLTFANEIITNLREILTDPSNVGLDPIWKRLGINRGQLYSAMIDCGIIVATVVNGKEIYKLTKKLQIRSLKLVYNIVYGKRYDISNGNVVDEPQDESVGFGSDFEPEMTEDNYPAGAEFDDNAPWNDDGDGYPEGDGNFFSYIDEVIDGKYRVLFLNGKEGKYVSIYRVDSHLYSDYCNTVDNDCVIKKINTLEINDKLDLSDNDFDPDKYVNLLNQDSIDYIMQFHINDEGSKERLEAVLNDLSETTAAAGSSGSYVGALNNENPIKKTNMRNPSEEMGETTMSAGSNGMYVQPQIWAKDPKNSKFSKDPMYPNGEIVAEGGDKLNRYILDLNEAYVYANSDEEAVKAGEEFIRTVKGEFPESHIEIVDIYESPKDGKEARKINKGTGSVYEKVAKETGRTISEVIDIINKRKK